MTHSKVSTHSGTTTSPLAGAAAKVRERGMAFIMGLLNGKAILPTHDETGHNRRKGREGVRNGVHLESKVLILNKKHPLPTEQLLTHGRYFGKA